METKTASPEKEFFFTATEPEFRTQEMLLNMGPSHPAMHGIVKIAVKLQGELVVDADIEIGYLHRAFEKSCEACTWNQAIIYTDRLNYVSPIINNVGYCMAVEKLLGIEIPPRGQYIRTLLCEVSRVADHLTCVAAAAMELGAMTVFLYMMKGREYLYELLEDFCGARVTTMATRVGGQPADLPDDWLDKLTGAIREVRVILKECHALLTCNRIFYDRVRGTGVMKGDDAIDWGFTGPCLRAAGVDYDVRKYFPYLVYDQVDWAIPVGTEGDNYDRYLVRMEEMEQSCRILEQCAKKIPGGPHSVEDKRIMLPDKKDTYGNIEGLMNHFKLIMHGHGIRVPVGEAYQAVEAGNGELGFYVVSYPIEGEENDGCASRPWKARCRPPCFHFVAALPDMIKGDMVADVIPTFGSINMIGGELDR
jgi:NADH-quinone oxidoreductase subunit D